MKCSSSFASCIWCSSADVLSAFLYSSSKKELGSFWSLDFPSLLLMEEEEEEEEEEVLVVLSLVIVWEKSI